MMNDIYTLLLVAAAGGVLGIFYFGGLRWTLCKSLTSRAAAVWFSLSFLLRSSVCLYGIYWVGANDFVRILVCLGGFTVARIIVMKLTPGSTFTCDSNANEAGHAS